MPTILAPQFEDVWWEQQPKTQWVKKKRLAEKTPRYGKKVKPITVQYKDRLMYESSQLQWDFCGSMGLKFFVRLKISAHTKSLFQLLIKV